MMLVKYTIINLLKNLIKIYIINLVNSIGNLFNPIDITTHLNNPISIKKTIF